MCPAIRALVPLVFTGGFVAMVAFVAWRTVAARLESPIGAAVVDRPAPARYERSALDEPSARALLACLDDVLTRERLFARPDLTLGQLADAAGSTPHLVSEALNRFGGTSFRDLVTSRRVDDVKAQLRDPHSDRYTIEGIGASAGFRSRSALYDAFHRREGMTPTAFRAARSGAPLGTDQRCGVTKMCFGRCIVTSMFGVSTVSAILRSPASEHSM